MNTPIRTTVVFALVSGILMLPLTRLLGFSDSYPVAFKCLIWLDLAVYSLLLARWSRTRRSLVLFPMALLLGAAFWPRAGSGFLVLALGILCWVRSGICYGGTPIRALTAELVTVGGGIVLVGALSTNLTAAVWPLALCLFILIQALYFFIIPAVNGQAPENAFPDPFEQARHEAEKLLEKLL
jgi:hypothetical protein